MKRPTYAAVFACALVLCIALVGCSSGASSNETAEAPSRQQENISSEAGGQKSETAEGSTEAGGASAAYSLSSFSAETIEGETFTQDDFAGYDLTMVNVWATFCTYCIDEMPALEELSQSLPENVNMISICADAADNKELTRQIVDECGVTFPVLIDNDKLDSCFLSSITGFPTTVFVDSNGSIVGAEQIGVPVSGNEETIVAAYLRLIDEHLAQVA